MGREVSPCVRQDEYSLKAIIIKTQGDPCSGGWYGGSWETIVIELFVGNPDAQKGENPTS